MVDRSPAPSTLPRLLPPSCGASASCAGCWSGGPRRFRPPHAARRIAVGADLVSQGGRLADVVTVLEGWLLLYELLEDGRRQILHVAVPGDALVPPPAATALPYGIQAATAAVVCVTPAREAYRLAETDPAIADRLLTLASRATLLAYEHMTALGRRTARERVALLLVELYCRCRMVMPPGRATRVPLTQAELGDALGLTAVHVNRTLRRLRQERLVDYEAGVLRILDPDRLAVVAALDPMAARPWLAEPEPTSVKAARAEGR